MQLLYLSLNPYTMGSILRQSIQVPAKNSTKRSSLCFGTSVIAGISPGDSGAAAVTGATVGSAGPQEDKEMARAKTSERILTLKDMLKSVLSIN
jgi:hypothetical protein